MGRCERGSLGEGYRALLRTTLVTFPGGTVYKKKTSVDDCHDNTSLEQVVSADEGMSGRLVGDWGRGGGAGEKQAALDKMARW